eukprot:454211_1
MTPSVVLALSLFTLCHSASTYYPWSAINLIPSSAPWTHFVYIIGDNNLDSAAVFDLEEMRQNTAKPNELNLVVYIDRYNSNPSQTAISNIYNCDTMAPISGIFTGSKILQKIQNKWCEMYNFGHELDSTQSPIIANFTGLMSQFELTSTYFMLEFWDHGGAWKGFGEDDNTAGSQSANSLNSLIVAIRTGLQLTHLGRLDILGFDACIMADYSELYYISQYDITKYYIASEVSEPGVGWDYLNGINTKSVNATEYAISIIDAYVNQKNVENAESSAGYTLALFDMDYVGQFLSEFDSLIRMMTLAVENYDYGIIMAILRAESSTIYAEGTNYMIQDLGLFLINLVDDQNIFFNSCNERLKMSGKSALQYLSKSIIHFNADFIRKDTMTGSTIFWSLNTDLINNYYSFIPHLSSFNYLTFLASISSVLSNLGSHSFTNASCSAQIPNDLTFSVSDEINIEYSSDYGLYKISKNVVKTVMKADTYLFYPYLLNNETLLFSIAKLETNIIDPNFHTTSSVTYWDGMMVTFFDSNNNSMFATGNISYTYDSTISTDGIPIGYIAKYPVNIHDASDFNFSVPGYIQFEVILRETNRKDTKTDMQLYGFIGSFIEPIPSSENVIIEGIANVIFNGTKFNVPNGRLSWTNMTKRISFYPFPIASIGIIESDVFGNKGESIINVMTNFSYQHISTPLTTEGTTLTTQRITTSTLGTVVTSLLLNSTITTIAMNNIKSSNETKRGLDNVPGLTWLLIVIALVIVNVVVIVLLILLFRKKQKKGFISKIEIKKHEVDIEMCDEPLQTETIQETL